jgi:hypothetical protein
MKFYGYGQSWGGDSKGAIRLGFCGHSSGFNLESRIASIELEEYVHHSRIYDTPGLVKPASAHYTRLH